MTKEHIEAVKKEYKFITFDDFKDLKDQKFYNKRIDFLDTIAYKYENEPCLENFLSQTYDDAKHDISCAVIKSCVDFFKHRKLTLLEQALSIAFNTLWDECDDNLNCEESIFKILKTIDPKRFQEIIDGKYIID